MRRHEHSRCGQRGSMAPRSRLWLNVHPSCTERSHSKPRLIHHQQYRRGQASGGMSLARSMSSGDGVCTYKTRGFLMVMNDRVTREQRLRVQLDSFHNGT